MLCSFCDAPATDPIVSYPGPGPIFHDKVCTVHRIEWSDVAYLEV